MVKLALTITMKNIMVAITVTTTAPKTHKKAHINNQQEEQNAQKQRNANKTKNTKTTKQQKTRPPHL